MNFQPQIKMIAQNVNLNEFRKMPNAMNSHQIALCTQGIQGTPILVLNGQITITKGKIAPLLRNDSAYSQPKMRTKTPKNVSKCKESKNIICHNCHA